MLFGACGETSSRPENPDPPIAIPFRDDGDLTFLRSGQAMIQVDIEIADDDSARTRGLMQRTSLPDRSGMLFVFEQEEMQAFHMANTPISLDLFFVSRDSVIVDIDKYNQPFSQSLIRSDVPAQYVIEMQAGFADTHGIIEGDQVHWVR